jgi:hypothetical protein
MSFCEIVIGVGPLDIGLVDASLAEMLLYFIVLDIIF